MHKGLPHNTILNYVSTTGSTLSESGAGDLLNIPRDLSATNRQHWMQTTPKGVPLVYRVAITVSPTVVDNAEDSSGGTDDTGSHLGFQTDDQLVQRVRVKTTHNNWVMRNASVKVHAAREHMFRKSGVRKSERGTYDNTIHFEWDSVSGTYLPPKDGDGANFTGGSWEFSKLIYDGDADGAFLKLIDTHASEESTTAFAVLSVPQLYLSSRRQVEADTNDTDDQPAQYSVLRKLFSANETGRLDEIVDMARDNQDQPPYDLAEDGDMTECVLASECFIGVKYNLQQTMVIDIPFGMCEVQNVQCFLDAGAANADCNLNYRVQVLDVYPMGEN